MSSSVEIVGNKTPKASPWAKINPPTSVCSLEEVMSEQLAQDLQKKEATSRLYINSELTAQDVLVIDSVMATTTELENQANQEASNLSKNTDIDNDFLLAQLLQLEYDKEYDEQLKQHENFKNRNQKVSVSFDKFTKVHPLINKIEKESEHREDISSSEESENELEKITFKNGVHGKGENMISKHDLALNARNNAFKVMKFPPEFETGDSHTINMRLHNNVFNSLKVHSMREEKRYNRLHDKSDKSTNEMSLDPKTKLILFKFVNANLLEEIGGVISTGKEATIFYAPGGKSQEILVPKECVVKVFKTTLNEFKTREKYIGDDYRFKDRYKHLNPQKIVRLWAEKEMHNLMKMRKFDIPCPDVVILKKHLLVMSFIGKDNVPAPKLKDANLDSNQLKKAYEQCIQLIKDLYHKCNLVHADFNQFNLLWHENRVWVIDVSQSVEPIHPMGLDFLLRDCDNVHKFFSNRKLDDVKTAEEIFNEVTGMNFKGEGNLFLSEIHKYKKNKEMELNQLSNDADEKNPYNFDYHFEKSLMNKLKEKAGLNDEEDEDDENEYEEVGSDQEEENKAETKIE